MAGSSAEKRRRLALALCERVDVLRRGPAAAREHLWRRRCESVEALGALERAAADAERGAALAALGRSLPALLDLGARVFAPGGEELAELLRFVELAAEAIDPKAP
jgi:hypothetical protein